MENTGDAFSHKAYDEQSASKFFVKKNWPALLMLAIIGIIYGFVGLPLANAYGRWWISVIFYAALLVAGIYARCNPDPIHSKVFHRKIRRTPQSL